MSGMLALGLSFVSVLPVKAQILSPRSETPTPNTNIKLNERQLEAIQKVSNFAFDQLEAILSSGFDSDTLKRPEANQEVEKLMRQIPDLIRPDQQQLSELRNLIKTARQQMEGRLERGLPKY
jgi:protein-tyrosine phosphatase